MDVSEIIVRLGAAVLIGGAIGLDRNLHHKPTGVRTLSSFDRARRTSALLKNTDQLRDFTLQQWQQLGKRSLFDVMATESEHYNLRVSYINALIDADIAFHNAVYAASRNPLIQRSAHLHWSHIRRAMGAVLQASTLRGSVWDEHEAIARAIAASVSIIRKMRASPPGRHRRETARPRARAARCRRRRRAWRNPRRVSVPMTNWSRSTRRARSRRPCRRSRRCRSQARDDWGTASGLLSWRA